MNCLTDSQLSPGAVKSVGIFHAYCSNNRYSAYFVIMSEQPTTSSRRRRKPKTPEPVSVEYDPATLDEPPYPGSQWPWDQYIATAFLERIRQGVPVHYLCGHPYWPSEHTIFNWRLERPEFQKEYWSAIDHAKSSRPDDETVAADSFESVRWLAWAVLYDPSIDEKRAKIALDAFKWLASKGHPAKFGANIDLSNRDGILSPEGMSQQEALAFINERIPKFDKE